MGRHHFRYNVFLNTITFFAFSLSFLVKTILCITEYKTKEKKNYYLNIKMEYNKSIKKNSTLHFEMYHIHYTYVPFWAIDQLSLDKKTFNVVIIRLPSRILKI